MDFKYLGSSVGCMRIQDMPLTIQSIFKMVGFSGSKRARTWDAVNPILGYVKSCIISGFQASGDILCQKKWCWGSRMGLFLANN